MEAWLGKFENQGLLLAAGVILLLFKILLRLLDLMTETLKQRSEEQSLLSEMSTMLRQLCNTPANQRAKRGE